MSLSEKKIKEFQRIFKETYGKDIPYKAAEESAYKLINFLEIICKNGDKINNKDVNSD